MNRRNFIYRSIIAGLVLPVLKACSATSKKIPGKIIGASAHIGHRLRDKNFNEPLSIEQVDVVIIGGGISGLSAARHLYNNGKTNFVVLDIEKEMGGNAAASANTVSAYPWGAHYVPLPNNNLTEYLDFLRGCGVIENTSPTGLPVYNELHLCFDPQERLYINGRWQDGVIPNYGVPDNELRQIKAFLALVDEMRAAKGFDSKDAFAIPVEASSKDEKYTLLDTLTMDQWLQRQGFTSTYLKWYINYATRDDFGTTTSRISAWAALHYFAARKGQGANASHHDVLTWPQGNGFLVDHLKNNYKEKLQNNCLAVKVEEKDNVVLVTFFNAEENTVKAYSCRQCVMAVPQFIAARLLQNNERKNIAKQHLHYTPWMVANIQTLPLSERSGQPLSWDNVIYNSKALGYVNACHQRVEQKTSKYNFTYYLPLTDELPAIERTKAQAKTHEDWVNIIINDIKNVHPDATEKIENIDVMLWGHAMAQPVPGLIHGNIRRQLAASVNNKIHFAHTDLAGISIFEEAFYQGIKAANKIIKQLA